MSWRSQDKAAGGELWEAAWNGSIACDTIASEASLFPSSAVSLPLNPLRTAESKGPLGHGSYAGIGKSLGFVFCHSS